MDEDQEGQFVNDFSGTADDIVQARDIYGDVNFHSSTEVFEASDQGYVAGTVYRGAGVAYFLALFLLSVAYTRVVAEADLGFWDWPKLAASTLALVTVLVRTERAIFGDLFTSLRRLAMAVVVALGIGQGPHWESFEKLTVLLGHWLVWRF
ncbi:hypothetical protein SAMN04489727_4358 [Amycolatopsis tolypomycina]|uniref:Uncharacterized protein n=1 Tax=Amycolatopsis tolypomycina TaxID=208445 RepID=A0A1H4TVX3_9PSEU|nr:hypothetical protein [Amycolatopsis tolypomycina]SEC60184.1 hypothetical protein SAMN04489727_4358 [Amycolatopsis tolypomycina]